MGNQINVSAIPSINPKVIFRPENDGYGLAFEMETESLVTFDPLGSRIWNLIDGKRSIETIIKTLTADSPSELLDITIRVMRSIDSLTAINYLSFAGEKTNETLLSVKNKPQLGTLYLYLTRNCNLHCKHCWISAGDGQANDFLAQNPARLLETINQAKTIGLQSIKLSGGEPFLKKELVHTLLSFCAENKIDVTIETNGTLLEEEDLALLKKVDAGLGISLDYLDAGQMDTFREGRDLVPRITHTVRQLVQAALSTQIIMTLTKKNLLEIEPMIRFCQAEGVGVLKLNPVSASGRANNLQKAGLILNGPILLEISQLVADLEKVYGFPVILEVPPVFRGICDYHHSRTGGRCNVLNLLGILSDGSVSICAVGYEVKSAVLGNIAEGPDLIEIWENHPFMKSMREGLPGKLRGICRDCIFKNSCFGACRAQLLEAGRDFFEPYPLCAELSERSLFPAKYLISTLRKEALV